MSKGKGSKDELAPIIVKKVKKVAGGHHGGAWKVAYADFVTAMMAFFLLLWLLNVTTSEQRNEIANFFDPTHPTISDSKSGSGGIMGGTAIAVQGAMTSTVQEISLPQTSGKTAQDRRQGDQGAKDIEALKQQLKEEEDERFANAKEKLEEEIKQNPELAKLAKNLMVDVTPEGLRIQIVDQEGDPMFPKGSAQMFDKTQKLMGSVAGVIKTMPNDISVRGHTDSFKYKDGATYTNWELSADRANSSRRVLLSNGVDGSRLSNVMGKADTEHLFIDNPLDARNRRISIILLREDLDKMVERIQGGETVPADGDTVPSEGVGSDANQQPVGTFKRTPGEVYFP